MSSLSPSGRIRVNVTGARGLRGQRGRDGSGTVDTDLRERIVDLGNSVAISGTVALTDNDFGLSFEATGTGPCNVTLPPAGNDEVGKALSFFVPASFSSLLTITSSNGGIDSQPELILWSKEGVSLRWDGSTWRRVFVVQRPFFGRLKMSSALTIPADGKAKQVIFDVAASDVSGFNLAYDATNKCFKAPRAGNWVFDYAGPILPTADADVRAFFQSGAFNGVPDENAINIAYYVAAKGRTWQQVTYAATASKGQTVAAFVQIVTSGSNVGGSVEAYPGVILPVLSYREIL